MLFRQPTLPFSDTDQPAHEPGWSVQSSTNNGPANLSATQPDLGISHQALGFTRTSPGRPTYSILTICQQSAETPVVLWTDSPDHFQLASDSQPAFASTLLFTPASRGTYVHVRYEASQMGVHTGNLFIQTPHECQCIPLRGSCWNLLPRAVNPSNAVPSASKPFRWGVGLLALAFTTGLWYYWNLYPSGFSWGQETTRSPTRADHHENNTLPTFNKIQLTETTKAIPRRTATSYSGKKRLANHRKSRVAHRWGKYPATGTVHPRPATGESDLERILNQSIPAHQK